MELLVGIFGGAATMAAALGVRGTAARRMEAAPEALERAAAPARLRDVLARVFAPVGRSRLFRGLTASARLRERLRLAGSAGTEEAFVGARVCAAVVAMLAVVTIAGASLPVVVAGAVASVGAFRVFDIALSRRARRRQQAIARRVPDLVELLVATTQAGLNPATALRRACETLHGPLADEVALSVREIDLGVPWRNALAALVGRTDVPSLRRLASSLTRSQRLGTSLGTSLRAVADELRAERRAVAEEAARRAPVKMLFPLVFLILPAFLLLTVGPVVLATVRSLH